MSDPGELSAEDVRRILELVDQSHFGELRLEMGDLRIYVRKAGVAPGPSAPAPGPRRRRPRRPNSRRRPSRRTPSPTAA